MTVATVVIRRFGPSGSSNKKNGILENTTAVIAKTVSEYLLDVVVIILSLTHGEANRLRNGYLGRSWKFYVLKNSVIKAFSRSTLKNPSYLPGLSAFSLANTSSGFSHKVS